MTALPVALLALLGLWLGTTAVTAPRAYADDKKLSLHIVMPIPAGNGSTVEGPVGTNVSVQGQGLTANADYQIGYARADIGCQAGMRSFDGVSPAPAQQDGTLTATVTWPDSLNSIGSIYVICAQNASQLGEPVVQSDEHFRVDSADHAQLTLKAVAASATGTATATPQPDGTFFLGQQVAITGKNFLPAGSKLVAYLLTGQARSASDLQPPVATALTTSAAITSQNNGGVTATVTLPDNIPTGSYFVYLVSDKGTQEILPALVASQPITITQAPAPQPTATVAPRPTATATPKTSSDQPIGEIVGLGGLSVVLFIVGVALLASAAAMSRPGR